MIGACEYLGPGIAAALPVIEYYESDRDEERRVHIIGFSRCRLLGVVWDDRVDGLLV